MGSSFRERKPPTDDEIRSYFQLLREDPRSRVFAPLAEALIRRGRLDEAEQICRLGLDANPDFSDGHLALARALFYRFRHAEALAEVKLALGLDRKNHEAYLIAAEIFAARSQVKAAVESCMRALDLDPQNQEAQRILQRLQGGAPPAEEAPPAQDPMAFRALAPTGPSQRARSDGRPPTDPFKALMVEVEADAEKAHAEAAQASAKRAAAAQAQAAQAEAARAQALQAEAQRAQAALDPAALFDHIPEHTPIPSHRPLALPAVPTAQVASELSRVDAAQAVIDRYGPPPDATDDTLEPSLRIPRAGRGLLLIALLLGLGGAGALIYLGDLASRGGADAGMAAPDASALTEPSPEVAVDAGGAAEVADPGWALEAVDAGPADAGGATEAVDAGGAAGAVDAGAPVDADEAAGSREDEGAAKKPAKKPPKKPLRKPPKKRGAR